MAETSSCCAKQDRELLGLHHFQLLLPLLLQRVVREMLPWPLQQQQPRILPSSLHAAV
jgi:hypothetical protein